MKNVTKFLLGILLIMMVFGFMVSCGADDGGTLTVTNIPAKFNGKFAVLEGYSRSVELFGAQSIDPSTESGAGARISNGKVKIPLWFENKNGTYVRYAGNNTFELEIEILNSPSTDDWDSIAYFEFESVKFSNGSATVSFHDADDFFEE